MRFSDKSNVYGVGAFAFIVLDLIGRAITGEGDSSMIAGSLIMTFLFLGELVSDYAKHNEPEVEKPNLKQFVPGKSEAYNAGWESFFIDRELSDNPHSAGSKTHNDWADGFNAAQASTTN